jgi:hypothetical protein
LSRDGLCPPPTTLFTTYLTLFAIYGTVLTMLAQANTALFDLQWVNSQSIDKRGALSVASNSRIRNTAHGAFRLCWNVWSLRLCKPQSKPLQTTCISLSLSLATHIQTTPQQAVQLLRRQRSRRRRYIPLWLNCLRRSRRRQRSRRHQGALTGILRRLQATPCRLMR